MDNLKKASIILAKDFIKASRPKTKIYLDIFPVSAPETKTAPQLDSFDLAVNRALGGEPKPERAAPKHAVRRPLTFDEKEKELLG